MGWVARPAGEDRAKLAMTIARNRSSKRTKQKVGTRVRWNIISKEEGDAVMVAVGPGGEGTVVGERYGKVCWLKRKRRMKRPVNPADGRSEPRDAMAVGPHPPDHQLRFSPLIPTSCTHRPFSFLYFAPPLHLIINNPKAGRMTRCDCC
ncbi:hypothetical protein GW17_00016986 [Ensete ventricosum]|nr:hypothetical protein GW17_00016986 [Ensete ventricosum]